MVIKNLENKIKLVTIFCGFFLAGCVLISLSSIWTARMMDRCPAESVCTGRQCTHFGTTDHEGGNA